MLAEVARTLAGPRPLADWYVGYVSTQAIGRSPNTPGATWTGPRLDSCHAVDALVVATAASSGDAVILAGDPNDLKSLAAADPCRRRPSADLELDGPPTGYASSQGCPERDSNPHALSGNGV